MDSSKIRSTSAWSGDEIELFLLESSIPARLACLTPSGAPLVCSLWYLYEDGADVLGGLIRRQDNEVAIRIDPAWITAWDYKQRMGA